MCLKSRRFNANDGTQVAGRMAGADNLRLRGNIPSIIWHELGRATVD
jgi:hypothetical protein